MKMVSMLDLRLKTEQIIAQLQKGQRMILTRRGKPVARLEPIGNAEISAEDPFYSLGQLAEEGLGLNNSEIDGILYGE